MVAAAKVPADKKRTEALAAYCALVLERIRSSKRRTPDGEPYAWLSEFPKSEMPSDVRSGGPMKFLYSRPDLFCIEGDRVFAAAARDAVVSVKSVKPASQQIAESTSVGGSALDAYHSVSAVKTAKQPASLQNAESTSVNSSELDAYCATVLERIRSSKRRTPDGKPCVNLGDFPASELPLDLQNGGPLKFLRSRPDLFCVQEYGGHKVVSAARGAVMAVKSVARLLHSSDLYQACNAKEGATSFSLPPVHISYELSELEALLEKHMQPGSVFGFDVEWSGSGENEIPALIQLATPQCIVLIPVKHLPALPDALLTLLFDSNTILLGVGIVQDVRGTMLLAGGRTAAARLVDVSIATKRSGMAPANSTVSQSLIGLADLMQLFGGPKLTKVSHGGSNWDAPMLSMKQITYAGTDAFAGLWIASRLHSAMQAHAARLMTKQPPSFEYWLMWEAAEQEIERPALKVHHEKVTAKRADAMAAPVIPAAAIVPLTVEPADADADQEGMRAFLLAQTEEHLDALLKAALPGKKNKPKRELLRLVSWPFFKRLAKTAGG